ncbi:MAG: ABC-type transport auxiliary lipoprotein family protein [Halieaceae bacterium]
MRYAAILLIVGLVACSGQPVETNYYLLGKDHAPESRELKGSRDFALGSVAIAAYIDQPGMMLEVGNGQIRPAMHHQWAEPMSQSVRMFLQREISQHLGEDLFPATISNAETVVEIRLDQLHGTADGQAVIFAYWYLRKDGEVIAPHQFGKTVDLTSDGYAALARAEQSLLAGLAKDIADALLAMRQE